MLAFSNPASPTYRSKGTRYVWPIRVCILIFTLATAALAAQNQLASKCSEVPSSSGPQLESLLDDVEVIFPPISGHPH
jgi:hypothetical protein